MAKTRRWSQEVTEHSDALDLETKVFTWRNPKKIADSLKHSAEESSRSKAKTPFQSAMAMLNFYLNRAGKNLPKTQKDVLQQAKEEIRKDFKRK